MSRWADKHQEKGNGLAAAVLAMLIAAFSAFSPVFAASLEAKDYKMAGDASHMRIVMNFDSEPDPKWFLLRGPHRLVIDLPETEIRDRPPGPEGEGTGQGRPLRTPGRGQFTADPDDKRAFCRRQA